MSSDEAALDGDRGQQAAAEVDEVGGGATLGSVGGPRLPVELAIALNECVHRDLDDGLEDGEAGELRSPAPGPGRVARARARASLRDRAASIETLAHIGCCGGLAYAA